MVLTLHFNILSSHFKANTFLVYLFFIECLLIELLAFIPIMMTRTAIRSPDLVIFEMILTVKQFIS